MKYIVTLNGKDYAVEVSNGSAEIVSTEAAAPAPAPAAAPAAAPKAAATPKAAAPKAAPAPVAGGKTVLAPMPGNIMKILVNQGDKVQNGQVLIILEAMKMENEIFSPCDGTIASISVAQGASVNSNDVILTIA